MPETHKTDLLVIGGGPGGYAAAFRAADLGLSVTLIEADNRLGGTCLLHGCIPSKALLHVAALIAQTQEAQHWGVTFSEPKIDLPALREWKNGIISRLSNGLAGLVRQRKVHHIQGFAEFDSSTSVVVKNNDDVSRIEFGNAIIATGSRPVNIPLFAIDSPRVMNSSEALELDEVPKSLLVVGGGIIGLELGNVYSGLGSEVTVVEMTDALVPGADADLIKPLAARLNRDFKAIHTRTRVTHLEEVNNGIEVHYESNSQQFVETFDRVLLAIGRRPNTDNITIENTKVERNDRGFITVDAQMRTSDANIFAIGDAVPGPGLAHKAAHEGHVAAEVLAGHGAVFDKVVPSVVYTDPEVAWVGLTENEAKQDNRKVDVARFPWAASGKATSIGRTEGLTKIISDPHTHRVLGMGIVGPHAGDLLAEGVLAIEMAAVVEDIAHSIHPHPSLSETVGVAAEIQLGSATDVYMPKK
ncbi:MAG: dihydrolipoyl dehydrogenase [Candidatus Latescibacteria bacterium]|jgi:dihydrolipoamide dehydrogenase|nr:dihydrolipoyl dehydrogenase [Candidatus Latescibacterota bacterium]MBT4137208.1 dihydrolipoyl dehydrogenase [Candidatus Latescibacterota bacterium]